MSIRIENCIQHPLFKDKNKTIHKTVNLLLLQHQDNTEFNWEGFKEGYDNKVNAIRNNAKLSKDEKEKKLKKIEQKFSYFKNARKRFVVGEDKFLNKDGMAYDKQLLNKNVFALHILGQYYFVVKYLEPQDR